MGTNKKLFELSEKDRFHFLSDRHKHVWQVDWIEEKERTNMFGKIEKYRVYHLIYDANVKKLEKTDCKVKYLRTI